MFVGTVGGGTGRGVGFVRRMRGRGGVNREGLIEVDGRCQCISG